MKKPQQFVEECLRKKRYKQLKSVLLHYSPHTIAKIINSLERGRRKTFSLLSSEVQADVLLFLYPDVKEHILANLSNHEIAVLLHFHDEDDAADTLQSLPKNRQPHVLSALKDEKRRKIEKLLTFGSETAGGLMDLNFIIAPETARMGEVMEKVHEHIAREHHTPLVVITGQKGTVQGYVTFRHLLSSPPDMPVSRLAQDLLVIPHTLDQERVLQYTQRMKGEVIAVTDDRGDVIGVIHTRDLLKVAQTEATEDIYRFAGVAAEENLYDSIVSKVRRRYRWLCINLGTAFIASFVVSRFHDTTSRITTLVAFMPVVAGLGGNTASQSLAVVVRGLAVGDIPWPRAWKVIVRESATGLLNGIIMGTVAAGVAVALDTPPMIGVVLGAAMILNLFIGGLVGALVPFTMKALNVDPAVASSIFVTATTDIFGFLSFLGLATVVLL